MGVLTEAAMRLRGEIVASRHARVFLRSDLIRQTDERRTEVSALCASFACDRAGARRAWFGPTLAEQTAERQQQRRVAENARVQAREKQRSLAEETAKEQAKQRPPEPPKAEPPPKAELQKPEAAKAVPASSARPPAEPLPHAHKPPFKGSKKH